MLTLLIGTCVLALCTHSPTDSSPAARTPASQPSRTAAAHVAWARIITTPMTCAPPSGSSVPVGRAQHLLIFTLLFCFSLLRTLRHHRHLPLRAAATRPPSLQLQHSPCCSESLPPISFLARRPLLALLVQPIPRLSFAEPPTYFVLSKQWLRSCFISVCSET